MVGNGGHVELPNSKCSVIMTSVCVYLLPEGADYFEEMRGLSPDIWVPAKEAETLAAVSGDPLMSYFFISADIGA